jgi:isopenicillin-N N-acyltransferase-like protein
MQAVEADPDELVATRVRYFRALRLLRLTPQHSIESLQAIQRDHVNFQDSICNHAQNEADPMDREKTITALLFDLNERRMMATWGNPCEHEYHTYQL